MDLALAAGAIPIEEPIIEAYLMKAIQKTDTKVNLLLPKITQMEK
jgi:hypothetical protein